MYLNVSLQIANKLGNLKKTFNYKIVTCFHGNAWAGVVRVVEAVVARQRGKRLCADAV
jgi:hypothetical protein